jgi:HEAT repeat protein
MRLILVLKKLLLLTLVPFLLLTPLSPSFTSYSTAPSMEEEVTSEKVKEEEEAAREVARLIDLLKIRSHKRDISNIEITWELIALGPPAVPALISEMKGGDAQTLGIAIYALGMIGDKRAIVPLYEFLPSVQEEEQSYFTSVKESICLSLGLIGDPNAIPLIMQGPYAANRTVGLGSFTNIAAISAFLGDVAVAPLLKTIDRYKNEKKVYGAIGALGKLADERAVPTLLSLLEHSDNNVKKLAIEALAQIGDPSYSGKIMPFLDSEDVVLRETAAEAMYYLRDPGAIDRLISLSAKDLNHQVRLKSLTALGVYNSEKTFQALLKGCYDENPIVRIVSIDWVGKSENKMGAATLRLKMKDRDPRVALASLNALIELLHKDSEKDFISILEKDSRWIMQKEALTKLDQIHSGKGTDHALAILRQKIDEGDKAREYKNTILATLSYLSRYGNKKTLKELKELKQNIDKVDIKEMFEGAINDLALMLRNGQDVTRWIETLKTGDTGDQAVAIEALGEIGDRSVVKTLIDHFGRVDVEIGSIIPKILGKIKDPSAQPFLEDLLVNDIYDRKEMFPARVHAAWALGEIGQHSSIKALKKVLLTYNGEPMTAIVAMAKLVGKEAIPDFREIKQLLLREPSRERMEHYDNINWLIRNLKNGWSITALDKKSIGTH